MSIDRVEPSADMRQNAHQLREMFIALVEEGFTEAQAVGIIGKILSAGMGSSS